MVPIPSRLRKQREFDFVDLARNRSGFRILVQIDLLSMDKRSVIARCLGVLLVLASSSLEVCVEAEGAASSCTIYGITECLEDINSYSAQPSQSCCAEIFALESGGPKAMDCLCTAVTSETARLYGVNPKSAIGMPQRCGLPVPRHAVCNSKFSFQRNSSSQLLIFMCL